MRYLISALISLAGSHAADSERLEETAFKSLIKYSEGLCRSSEEGQDNMQILIKGLSDQFFS